MDLKALDQATDYRALLDVLFGDLDKKGEGREVYMTPPMRPEEKVAEMRFSVNTATGMWKDHKTGEQGNMLTLAKKYAGTGWRDRWIDANPQAASVFGQRSGQPTASAARSSSGRKTSSASHSTSQPTASSSQEDAFLSQMAAAQAAPSGLFARAAQGAAASAPANAAPKRTRPSVKDDGRLTFAQVAQRGQKMTTEDACQPFTEEWRVPVEVVLRNGAWCFTHTKGRLAGKPQMFFPMVDPKTRQTVGIKQRGLEPIYAAGDKQLKSKNQKGSKIGMWPWGSSTGKPLLIVEGEKDALVAMAEFGDRFDVLANLGGASTFKQAWVDPITEQWDDIYICYDADDAGAKGARKAATLLRGGERSVRVVHLPGSGVDLYDLLRGDSPDQEAVVGAFEAASPLGELSPEEVDFFISTAMEDDDLKQNDFFMAEKLYEIMMDNGALFYQDEGKVAYCSWRNRVYEVDRSNNAWNLLLAKYTGLSRASSMGGKLHDTIASLARERGKPVDAGRWTHWDGDAMYFQLYNQEQDLVRITAEGISIVPNGYDDVIFLPSKQVPEIEYLPDDVYNHDEGEKVWRSLWESLNCAPKWQAMTDALFKSFFMYDFMQTHPIVRFQGAAGSGKSTAQQILSLFLYGHKDLIGDITAAALFRLARSMPVIVQDDLEDKDVRKADWLTKFMLRAAMGGVRHMAGGDSDTETVDQQISCWVVNSGIHSIADDNNALNERLIVVPVRDKSERTGRFVAMKIFGQVKKNRMLLWNYIFREVQRMYHLVEDGAMERIMERMPNDLRNRLHETYALMAIARGCEDEPDHMVLEWLESAHRGEQRAVVESSHVSDLLFYLPSFLGDGTEGSGHAASTQFKEIEVSQDNGLWRARVDANTMHVILSTMARTVGLRYWMQNARRLGGELRSLRAAGSSEGLELEYNQRAVRVGRKVVRLWTIEIDVESVRLLPKDATVGTDEPQPEAADDDIPF